MGIPPRTYGALQVRLRESLVTRALVLPIQQFIHIQGISSVLLLGAAIAALVWANSPWQDSYHHVWEMELSLSRLNLPVHAWINDALMAIFFFLVGMEIKHEIVHGELADMRRAALPIFGALGGMMVPAALFMVLNYRQPGQHGWGVPMATDIAFSLGVLGMVKGIPQDLKIFLLSLAIADDIGAIAVIAIFYSDSLQPGVPRHWSASVGGYLPVAQGRNLAAGLVLRAGGGLLGGDSAIGYSRDDRGSGAGVHGADYRDLVAAASFRSLARGLWRRFRAALATATRRQRTTCWALSRSWCRTRNRLPNC